MLGLTFSALQIHCRHNVIFQVRCTGGADFGCNSCKRYSVIITCLCQPCSSIGPFNNAYL